MVRVRPAQDLAARQGVILLVVITLLTLFAVVGITFVIYAQAEASSMRVARQSESLTYPDADPEMLLAYYLSQLIYGVQPGQGSAMQNWDLATNMYGVPGNTVPFNGTGRLQNAPSGYWNLNYAITGASPAKDGAPNPPYTYPDVNSLFLAAVQPSTGNVLIPSFVRNGATNPLIMRATLPFQPEDGFADVKNLPTSPGWQQASGTVTPNDSIWMDLGFPVINGPDGRPFKPLFAALIQDLDGRANVNMHGNVLGSLPNGTAPYSSLSHQGWSPGEVNLGASILTMNNEAPNLLLPNNGRYDLNKWTTTKELLKNSYAPGGHFYSATNIDASPAGAAGAALTLPTSTTNTGWGFPIYGAAYGNGWWTASSATNTEAVFNPMLFNFFDPTQNFYNSVAEIGPFQYRAFPASDMEALLRFGDTGSPALTSDLLNLCSTSFQNFRSPLASPPSAPIAGNNTAMRLLTTHSFDLSVAGVMPCISMNPANPASPLAQPYQLAQPAGTPPAPGYPTLAQTVQQLMFPPTSPNAGEFGSNWNAMASAPNLQVLKRIDLNRGFADYQTLSATTDQFNLPGNLSYPLLPAGTSNPQATFATALQSRQIMAQEIFDVLCTVTGATCTVQGNGQPIIVPANLLPTGATQPQYDALRWLAQLAVNIVDFVNFSQAQQSGNPPAPDDIMTSFNWNPAANSGANPVNNGWVFGTVLPRLVINEAFVQIANNPTDPGVNPPPPPPQVAKATMYDINCWIELHNPFSSDTGAGAGQVNANASVPTPLQGRARLYFPAPNPTSSTPNVYAGYRVIVAQTSVATGSDNTKVMTANDNVLGVPQNIAQTKSKESGTVVDTYSAAAQTSASSPQKITMDPSVDVTQVKPGFQAGKMQSPAPAAKTSGSATGFYVLGPNTPFPGTSNNPFFATLPVDNTQTLTTYTTNDTTLTQTVEGVTTNNNSLTGMKNDMHYTINTGTFPTTLPTHTIALQRLACPYMAPQPDPTKANFNPYVTVDYILSAPTYDAVQTDGSGTGLNKHATTTAGKNYSMGRNQPYAADASQLIQQGKAGTDTNMGTAAGQPGNTFFSINAQTAGQTGQQWAYDWLFHANRPLVSPIELLQVSGYKPHQLTQMFMTQGANPQKPTPTGIFQHRAPWITSSQMPTNPPLSSPMIYRALEFFEAGLRPQWTPIGGRFPAKININTIWDPSTFMALADPQANNFFTFANLYPTLCNAITGSRTPTGIPGPNDMPFYSLAAPFAPAAGQYPQGSGIQNTLLRPDTNAANLTNNPLKLLIEPATLASGASNSTAGPTPAAIGHPYLRMELLNKIFNSVTTRSNVFAVWLTVGFFDMSTGTLGQEINKAEGRNVRHRMFAIIDRTNLSIALNPQGQAAGPPFQQGPRPFFINSLTAVVPTLPPPPNTPPTVLSAPVSATITVPTLTGNYEDATWGIQNNMQLVIDSGPNQEIVTVTAVAGQTFTATFTKPHPVGFAISNAVLGNPGPQPFFDPRNPQFTGVVRYFSIIQ